MGWGCYIGLMMKMILQVILGVVVFGLIACDSASPPDAAVNESGEPQSIPSAAGVADDARAEEAAAATRRSLYEILRLQDVYTRTQRLAALLPTLGPEAASLIPEIFKDPMLSLEASDHALLVRFWATHEPPKACQWALTEAPLISRMAAISAGFTVWAEMDPLAVKAASEKRIAQVGEARDAVQTALVVGWFRANPEQLTQHLGTIDMGLTRQRVISVYLHQLIRAQGPDAAMRWAESLSGDVTFKTAVYRQVAAALPVFDHAAAIRWCEAHCDGPYGKSMRNMIARRWVLTDGPAALTWLGETGPEGYETNIALRAAYAIWGRLDRRAAVDWMGSQSAEAKAGWLRPAIPVYARMLAEDSPAEAIVLAEGIADDDERENLLIGVARIWRDVDAAAADAWLLRSELSQEAREKVRAPVRRMGPNG
jgi:hypothetical protein